MHITTRNLAAAARKPGKPTLSGYVSQSPLSGFTKCFASGLLTVSLTTGIFASLAAPCVAVDSPDIWPLTITSTTALTATDGISMSNRTAVGIGEAIPFASPEYA